MYYIHIYIIYILYIYIFKVTGMPYTCLFPAVCWLQGRCEAGAPILDHVMRHVVRMLNNRMEGTVCDTSLRLAHQASSGLPPGRSTLVKVKVKAA